MSYEPTNGILERALAQSALLREWEAQHPELSTAWDAALREDDARQRKNKHLTEQRGRMAAHLSACGASADAIECIVGGFGLGETAALAAVRKFIKAPETFLLLTGGPGAGKTAAASRLMLQAQRFGWCANCWLEARSYSSLNGLVVRAAELARKSVFGPEADAFWQQLARVEWLLLDELGTEPMPEKGLWLGMLDALIDERWREKRKTALTTNLDPATFAKRYGARIADRVAGDGLVVGCGDVSLRRKSA